MQAPMANTASTSPPISTAGENRGFWACVDKGPTDIAQKQVIDHAHDEDDGHDAGNQRWTLTPLPVTRRTITSTDSAVRTAVQAQAINQVQA